MDWKAVVSEWRGKRGRWTGPYIPIEGHILKSELPYCRPISITVGPSIEVARVVVVVVSLEEDGHGGEEEQARKDGW